MSNMKLVGPNESLPRVAPKPCPTSLEELRGLEIGESLLVVSEVTNLKKLELLGHQIGDLKLPGILYTRVPFGWFVGDEYILDRGEA